VARVTNREEDRLVLSSPFLASVTPRPPHRVFGVFAEVEALGLGMIGHGSVIVVVHAQSSVREEEDKGDQGTRGGFHSLSPKTPNRSNR